MAGYIYYALGLYNFWKYQTKCSPLSVHYDVWDACQVQFFLIQAKQGGFRKEEAS